VDPSNTAPVIDQVSITPSAPTTDQTLTATVDAHDDQGDPITLSYQWTLNGGDLSGQTGSTLDLSTQGNGDHGDQIGVRVVASDAREALEAADLVVTMVTVPLEPRLDAVNTHADAVLLPVDYDDALGAEAANAATLYVVDEPGQYASVADRHWHGFREPDGELAQVVTGELEVPTSGRRVFLDMGIAMDDVALGALCYERALERGIGRTIEFP